jgi:hypothetical protein
MAHLVFVFWGMWGIDVGIEAPEFEFEFETVELVDPDMLQGDEPEEPVAPPPLVGPPEPPPTEGEGEQPEEPEEPAEEKKFGDKHSKVDNLGPTNSTFYMMLATKKVAKLPFAGEAAEIMAPLPDFEFIVQGGGFHPFRDFEYLVLASPDIRDVTQTFLAVNYKIPRAELKAGLKRAAQADGQSLVWEEREGLEVAQPKPVDPERKDWDPRFLVILDDKVAVYVREEFLAQILEGPDTKKGKTAGNFVANIAKMRRFTRQEPRAGMQLVMKDLRSALKAGSVKGMPFEFPNDLEIMAEAATEPELLIRVGFLNKSHAKGAEKFWKEDLKEIIDSKLSIKFMVGGFYSSTEVTQEGKELLLRNKFDSAQAQTILSLIADGSRKMMKKSKEEMDERRKARDEMWKARKGGKLLPSEVIAKQKGEEAPKEDDAPESPNEPEPSEAPAEDPTAPAGGEDEPTL